VRKEISIADPNEDELYQGYLAKVYSKPVLTSPSSKEEDALIQAGICITYGELLYPSVKKLLHIARLAPTDIFLDLGSGLGKCVLQIFLQTALQKVIGIEAIPALHQQACQAQEQMQAALPFLWENRTLDLVEGNFLEKDWQGATIVYSCSTCFDRRLLNAIGHKINEEKQVQQVFSLRALPTLKRLRLKKVFVVECSWDSALCFYYTHSR